MVPLLSLKMVSGAVVVEGASREECEEGFMMQQMLHLTSSRRALPKDTYLPIQGWNRTICRYGPCQPRIPRVTVK